MINRIIIFPFLFACSVAIIQTCSSNNDCPPQSACVNQYCQCNFPFILDCQTSASLITGNIQYFMLSNVSSYMQTQNQNPNVYYSFIFEVCLDPDNTNIDVINSYNLFFQLFINTGNNNLAESSVGNVTTPLTQFLNNGPCMQYVQYQIKLEKQPNGQTQNLIVSMKIIPISLSNQIQNATANIGIKVTTKQLVSSQLLIKLAIGIICFASFVAICIIIFCCYQRYKKRKEQQERLSYHQQQVELFKKNTPQIQAKSINIPPMTTCSICLGDFEPDNKIRKTVCKHLFHSQCIDNWCQKNLSCPVCRLDLDQTSIKQKQKQIEMTTYRWNQNSLSGRDQLIQNLQPNQTTN